MRFNNDCAFDTEKHAYTYKWEKLVSVTTHLNLLSKDLTQWWANMAIEYLENKHNITQDDFNMAKVAWKNIRDSSASVGTSVHNAIEEYIKTWEVTIEHLCFNAFLKFKDTVKILESEVKVVNPEFWYAGTLDVIYERDGKKFIGDFKTSNGIYGSYLLQLSAYALALDEQVDWIAIIHLGKDWNYEVLEIEDFSEYTEWFKLLATLSPIYKKCESICNGKEKHRLKFNAKTYVG